MPIVTPGNPRTNWRRRNPLGESPDRFEENARVFVRDPGRSPGTMESDRRKAGDELAPGLLRRLWRQNIAMIPGPPPVQWSDSPAEFTRALRYRAGSIYRPAGSMNSRFTNLHTVVKMVSRQPRPTLSAGVRRGQPTVRNRMTSFGSRVEPLNRRVPAAQGLKP